MSSQQGPRTARVLAFACLLMVAAAALYLDGGQHWRPDAALRVPWWALLGMFIAADALVIHVEFRGDAQTFSLSELPIALAWFFATPGDLLVARVVGGLVVIVLISRQGTLKVLFNIALLSFYASFSLWIFQNLAVGTTFGTHMWPAVYLALSAATVLDTLAIAAVIRLAGGEASWREIRKMVAIAVFGVVATASLAMLSLTALQETPLAGVLILVLIGVLYGVFRGYASISKRYEKLEQLYEFTKILNRSAEFGSAARAVLSEARELLRSQRAVLSLRDGDVDVIRVTLDANGELQNALQGEHAVDPAFDLAVETRAPVLIPRGTRGAMAAALHAHDAKDLVMVPLIQSDRVIGTITMLDRLGEVSTFDGEDAKVLATFANHASMALDNARLIDELRKEAEDREHEALHDSLTALANRSHFLQRSVSALLGSTRAGRSTAVLLMDLDRFKDVNDTLGHHHGDQLLVEVGRRLEAAAPPSALVARLGGDEFAILLPAVDGSHEAIAVGEELHSIFSTSFIIEGIDLTVDGSIGVAVSPDHGHTPEQLLQRADVAMYVAKDSDHAAVMLYDEEQNAHSARRLALAAALRQAIDGRELTVAFQPKVSLITDEVVGVEALARWTHPAFGAIGPDEFIPLAEHVGLMRPLTMLILDIALSQVCDWRTRGFDLDVAVNISVRNLLDPNLPRDVASMLGRHGVDPARLTLEITESEIMRDPERTMVILSRMRDLGVSLSIDDFGTGHSSLAYLKQLPVTEVKIDRTFVGQVANNQVDSTIVRSIVDVARFRNLRVVAEGVEDAATLERLRSLGCDIAQGFFLCRPVSGSSLVVWLDERSSRKSPQVAIGARCT